jgi:hypothetical protein
MKTEKGARMGPRPFVDEVVSVPLLNGGEHLFDCRRFQLLQRLCFDLPDPLSCDRQVLSNLFKRAGFIVTNAESKPDHGLLSWGQGPENPVELIGHFRAVYVGIRRHSLQIWKQLTEFCPAVASWGC